LKDSEPMKKGKVWEERYQNLLEKYEALEKRYEEEFEENRQKEHMLIQQSKLAAMGEMIASIGHQWRQPLNHLSLLIQDVSEALELGEITDRYIDQFTKESMTQIKHMSQTINDFRKFYSPQKVRNSFSIGECVEDSLSIFSSSLKAHHIHVVFEYRGEQMSIGYPNEFSQAILNILTNAKDAFIQRNVKNRILMINIINNGSFYGVEFIDNAGGIEIDCLPKLFDPYYTTRPQGTGLGLYMSKMILEKMGGSIKAENTNNGAKFLLFVPKASNEIMNTSMSM
jgi:C4-dicarboxylate-specific signal transduction histidine kinase